MKSDSLFTLQPGEHYAMECIFQSGERHFSPIRVDRVVPRKSGKGLMLLNFWHYNYTQGVQGKGYELRVVSRAEGFLMAVRVSSSGSYRMPVILSPISAEWMREHFPESRFDEWCVQDSFGDDMKSKA